MQNARNENSFETIMNLVSSLKDLYVEITYHVMFYNSNFCHGPNYITAFVLYFLSSLYLSIDNLCARQ